METHTKKRKPIKCFKVSLNIILTIQLALMPYYGYSALDPESVIQNTLLQIQNTKEDLKKDQTLIDLSVAIETGKVKEYLKENPLVKKEVDYFLLSDQRVEAIEHHFDTNKKEVIESVSQTLHLNEYNNRPIYVTFKEVQVRYKEEERILIFEGLSEGAVRLRQYIPNMDIVDYINDGEVLVILDKNKGLLLVDMILVRSYLGLAPVPVAQIPVPVLKTLSELSPESPLWTKQNISVEFIHRGARPPDIIVEEIRQKIDKTFDGREMVFAGDLMISYIDQNSQKHLVQFLKREEMQGWLGLNYKMLDIMTKVVAPHLMEKKDLDMVEKEIETLKAKDPKAMLDHILSTIFNKQALYKLGLAKEGIQKRIEHTSQKLSPRDTMLYNEWQDSFNKIHPRLVESAQIKEQEKSSALSSAEIGNLLKQQEEKREKNKKTKFMALRIIANVTAKIAKGVGSFAKEAPKEAPIATAGLTAVLGSGLAYTFDYFQLETWTNLFYKITSVFSSMGYGGDFTLYKVTAFPHFITTFLLFPGIVVSCALLFNPIVKWLAKKSSQNFSIGSKVYHPKGYWTDVLNKWGSADFKKKFLGAGMKFYAYGIYPMWNLISVSGQPHFIAALRKGLKPFEVIDPKSDVGEIVGIKKPTKLGVGKAQWSKSKQFDQQRELQNVALAKQNRIKSLAWQMAVLAVAGKEQVTPDQIIMYGITGVNFKDLKKVHNDMTLKMEMLWTFKNLEKEIKALNDMDIRKALSELEPEMIVRYYERAKQIAKEAKAQPYFFKKSRAFWNTGFMGKVRQKLNLQSIASFNKPAFDLLNQVPTDFVTERSWREFVTDHLLVVLMPMLMTNRANLSAEHIYQIAMNENFLSYSGRPHIYDVWKNAYEWLFISGAGNALAYMNKVDTVEKLHTGNKNFYEPVEKHINPIKERVISELSYFKNQAQAILPSSVQEDPNRMRFGNIWLKHTVATLRSVQLGIIMALALRAGVVGQPVSEALSAWFLIHMSQFWFIGWPWMIIHGGHALSNQKITKNIEKMESLKTKLLYIAKGAYPDTHTMKKDFEEAVNELKTLYSDKEWDKWQKKVWVDPASETDISAIIRTSEHYTKHLAEHPPLPNKYNQKLDYVWSMVFGSILTTYLGVELFIWTFDSNTLRTENLIKWAGINIALLSFLYFFYRQSLGEHWHDLVTGEKRKARIEKIKHELKDWTKAIKSLKELKKPEERWSLYFYGKMLNLKASVSSKCQKAFTKNK